MYTKQILKKKFSIDTITVTRTDNFTSLADSLAYKGKVGKVYGPYGQKGHRFLVQILSKAPNLFYHINQIFIDTAVFRARIADSLANSIIKRLNDGSATFGQLALTYSMGGEGRTQGDIGWIARGMLLPQIEHEVINRKKGEIFKIWSSRGLHIIRKMDDPRQDTGFALIMRVSLTVNEKYAASPDAEQEAIDARRKSDSILTEFKKVNDGLKKQPDSISGYSDSTSKDSIMTQLKKFDPPGHVERK